MAKLNRQGFPRGGFMIQDASWAGGQHLMSRALSNDLRERVLAAVAAGESCRSSGAAHSPGSNHVLVHKREYSRRPV